MYIYIYIYIYTTCSLIAHSLHTSETPPDANTAGAIDPSQMNECEREGRKEMCEEGSSCLRQSGVTPQISPSLPLRSIPSLCLLARYCRGEGSLPLVV